MEQLHFFTIAGGDNRMDWAGIWLQEQGHRVLPWPCEDFTHLILPISGPGDLTALIPRLGPGKTVLGANLGHTSGLLEETGARVLDYFNHEPFLAGNAAITAEGALSLAMAQQDVTLWGSNALVCGWGRIGQLLAHRLLALGSNVTVLARSARERGMIEALGMHAIAPGDCSPLEEMDLIFNTIPAPVYTAGQLAATKQNCFLLELASVSGLEHTPNKPVVMGRGLPGRYGPRTAGLLLGQTILELLELT